MQILHLSGDFPDPLNTAKTKAVRGLIELADGFQHHVYSLNRVGPHHGTTALTFDQDHRAVTYGAPPMGLLHRVFLERLARWIMRDVAARRLDPVAIHAHKLSIEAVVGARLSEWMQIPMLVSCQGNSDLKIIRKKPDLRPLWRQLWHGADWVFPFAPWTQHALDETLGPRTGPITLLPCPTPADQIIAPKVVGPTITSVFNLDQFANKNAALMIQAAVIAAAKRPDLRFEVIGTGSPSAFAQLSSLIRPYGSVVTLKGPVSNGGVQQVLNQSACLVLPSRRESYGMVFSEALLAGCPVIHGAGNGISGYFDDTGFARPVRSGGAHGLAAQLIEMIESEAQIKAGLALAQSAGRLDILRRPSIAQKYRTALCTVVGIQSAEVNSLQSKPTVAGPELANAQ